MIITTMPVGWRYEPDAAAQVLFVVSAFERQHPFT
jgi:hypothetical protein